MNFRFDQPGCLWLLLLAVPLLAMGWRGVGRLGWMDKARRWVAVAVRLVVLVFLVLMLAGLEGVRWHKELSVVAVVDESASVRFVKPPQNVEMPAGVKAPAAGADELRNINDYIRWWVSESGAKRDADDRIGLVTFDGRATVRAMPSTSTDLGSSAHELPTDGSDAAEAVTMGMAIFPPDSGKRMLLVGDGNFTGTSEAAGGAAKPQAGMLAGRSGAASLLAAARRAKAAGVVIDVLPLEYKVGNEVMVEGIYAPSEARESQTAGLRVVLRATAPSSGTLKLKHDGEVITLGTGGNTGVRITAKDWTIAEGSSVAPPGAVGGDVGEEGVKAYTCVRMVDVPLRYTGVNRFVAVFEDDAGQDTMKANNTSETFTMVRGKGRVLFVNGVDGVPGQVLPKALSSHGVQVDVTDGPGIPSSLAKLQRYEAVVLQNVGADLIPPGQQANLARYVTEMGGGLVLVGGPDSFGAGGWTNSPIDKIMPVDCQIPSQTILPTGALVIVIDRSGSMAEGVGGAAGVNKLQVACEAAVMAIQTLYPQDMVGVVVFDSEGQWIVPLRMNTNPAKTAQTVRSVQLGGGTDISAGLSLAVDAITKVKAQEAAVKHVILLTDGMSAPGPYDEMLDKLRRSNTTLSTVGVGNGVDTNLLTKLAMGGGGSYHAVTDANVLPQIFIKEAKSVRKNLIKEKVFSPVFAQTGSPIMAGIKGTPPLKGLVLTSAKKDSRVFMPMMGDEGEPLFAHWQVGLGRTAAFTSDATSRWAPEWLNWGGYADFWVRTIRAIARPSDSRQFDMIGSVEGDTLRIRLDAGDAEEAASETKTGVARGVRLKRVVAAVIRPDGTSSMISLKQIGPSVFEGTTAAVPTGAYMANLFLEDVDGNRFTVIGGAAKPVGGELRDFGSNRAVLEEVAKITGGRILSPDKVDPGTLFERNNVQPTRSVRPLWDVLLMWVIGLFLLDVAARRIAWSWGGIVMWFRRKWDGWRSTSGPRGETAAATLGALKARAAEVDRGISARASETGGGAKPQAGAGGDGGGGVVKEKKFEAGDGAAGGAGDLADAIGGAKRSDGEKVVKPTAEKKPEGPTTSRLLDAKRRAKEQMEGEEQK